MAATRWPSLIPPEHLKRITLTKAEVECISLHLNAIWEMKRLTKREVKARLMDVVEHFDGSLKL